MSWGLCDGGSGGGWAANYPPNNAQHHQNKTKQNKTKNKKVEAARYGLELLDRSQRHAGKLRACVARIDALCAEASSLVDHHDKIRALSYAHRNVGKVSVLCVVLNVV